MATKEQIESIRDYVLHTHSVVSFKRMSEGSAGSGAVLRYLEEASDGVTAGQISAFLHVSTARVAVLLRKLSEKGLIVRDGDANDARVTIVRLSASGKEQVVRMKDEAEAQIGLLIDRLGMEKLLEFFSIAEEIRAALPPPESLL